MSLVFGGFAIYKIATKIHLIIMRRRTQQTKTAEVPQGSPSHQPTKKQQRPRHDYEQVAEGTGGRTEEGTLDSEEEIIIENQTYGKAAAIKKK